MKFNFGTFIILSVIAFADAAGANANEEQKSLRGGLKAMQDKVLDSTAASKDEHDHKDNEKMMTIIIGDDDEDIMNSNIINNNQQDERALENHVYSWAYYKGAIRKSQNAHDKGTQGSDYDLYTGKTHSWCRDQCSHFSWCKSYEYHAGNQRCELLVWIL